MKCLESLAPIKDSWELILVANGLDLPSSIITQAESLTPRLKILRSAEKFTPGRARNFGLKESTGAWTYLLDDDASVPLEYWSLVFPLLLDTKIDVLGGPDKSPPHSGAFPESLAIALSSPFCTGPTFLRHDGKGKALRPATEECLTSCNLWVKTHLAQTYPFPEDYLRAEESLFLQTLKKIGAGLFYHPHLKVNHERRKNIKGLLRPTFFAGYYRSRLMREKLTWHRRSFWLPAVFVLLHSLYFFSPLFFWSLVQIYLGLIGLMSLSLSMKVRKPWLFPLVGFLHYFVVFVYGLGFLSERLEKPWK